jgi:hypothetical protein
MAGLPTEVLTKVRPATRSEVAPGYPLQSPDAKRHRGISAAILGRCQHTVFLHLINNTTIEFTLCLRDFVATPFPKKK